MIFLKYKSFMMILLLDVLLLRRGIKSWMYHRSGRCNVDIRRVENENVTDIVTMFNFLRDGSYNHYWLFDKGLKNKGVADGCYSLDTAHYYPEYPQNKNGNN